MKGSQVSIDHVSKRFGDFIALSDINFVIKAGEFFSLLGPSGCGKTTLLRIIAGFEKPDDGVVLFDDTNVIPFSPDKRHSNTVFQTYALFPHLSVYDNIAFPLRLKKVPKAEIDEKVKKYVHLVQLDEHISKKPNQLSGGQKQRVAIARALINEPKVLLLDEPLGALDLKLRKDMQAELKNIHNTLGITFVLVTHDQEEALSMSDTVVVMDKGKIQQIGTPTDIYNEPKNAFVADFIGESNIVDGVMLDEYKVKFAGQEFKCMDKGFGNTLPVDVVIRPEDIKVTSPEEGDISGIVTSVTFKGVHNEIIVDIDGFKWMIQTTESQKEGDSIGMVINPDGIHIMKKSSYSSEVGDYSAFSDEFYEEQHPHKQEN